MPSHRQMSSSWLSYLLTTHTASVSHWVDKKEAFDYAPPEQMTEITFRGGLLSHCFTKNAKNKHYSNNM